MNVFREIRAIAVETEIPGCLCRRQEPGDNSIEGKRLLLQRTTTELGVLFLTNSTEGSMVLYITDGYINEPSIFFLSGHCMVGGSANGKRGCKAVMISNSDAI